MRASVVVGVLFYVGIVAAQVPTWPQSWALNQSTIMMTCNYSGFVDPSTTTRWSIVDFGA